ncbi:MULTISPECIES: hypothetical protein [Micromonospora]|uniref:Uncharacterized protein n=1 Tax=Micromonospora noduli TaxID=709876 RepID=A0A328N293_9ACTN|nr:MULTISPECIES: hypothetical protein [Micromonospora]MBQ1019791.1 hypothetical protein [Micromonospora sp. D93]RAO00819.1 hypothetical protein LAH08_03072 [Micromonospora noduli]
MTNQFLHLAANASKETNPLLLPIFTLAGVVVGIAGQWLVAYINRRHERGLADLPARREAYARYRTSLRSVTTAKDKLDRLNKELASAHNDLRQAGRRAVELEPRVESILVGGSARVRLNKEVIAALDAHKAAQDKHSALMTERETLQGTREQAYRDFGEARTLVHFLGTKKVRRTAEDLWIVTLASPHPDFSQAEQLQESAEVDFIEAVREEFGSKD